MLFFCVFSVFKWFVCCFQLTSFDDKSKSLFSDSETLLVSLVDVSTWRKKINRGKVLSIHTFRQSFTRQSYKNNFFSTMCRFVGFFFFFLSCWFCFGFCFTLVQITPITTAHSIDLSIALSMSLLNDIVQPKLIRQVE